MKTLPGMFGIGKLCLVFVLIPHLSIWSINGEKSCKEQLHVKRHSIYTVSAGKSFDLKCPVKYCTNRPDVIWCKLEGKSCLSFRYKHHTYTSWDEKENISAFILHFNRVLPDDTGSYRCSANLSSGLVESHSITINVTEWTRNNSKYPLITSTHISDTTSASGPPSAKVTDERQWMLYSLLPLGALILLTICVYLFCCLRRHQEPWIMISSGTTHPSTKKTDGLFQVLSSHAEQKKPSDTARREVNLVDIPQPFRSEQTEVGTRQNPQTLPSETSTYHNEPWFRVQEESEVYSNPCLEENKQSIVYASLNHSVTGINPRQPRNVKEAPTEYAAICVRS
ncbi:B- and T-lymphocyte attenuator isoform X1 [Mustela erminea]|uniref:B- and T-lymphocyte attenuator isoform X1 n=1 Tax=Mustela erminea TaxID=36723 RepID=UPI001386C264|nr:B- and T-lymphocyte attenuator isoform X1 [Mustela erminea]